jgi:hypothetical protein
MNTLKKVHELTDDELSKEWADLSGYTLKRPGTRADYYAYSKEKHPGFIGNPLQSAIWTEFVLSQITQNYYLTTIRYSQSEERWVVYVHNLDDKQFMGYHENFRRAVVEAAVMAMREAAI